METTLHNLAVANWKGVSQGKPDVYSLDALFYMRHLATTICIDVLQASRHIVCPHYWAHPYIKHNSILTE